LDIVTGWLPKKLPTDRDKTAVYFKNRKEKLPPEEVLFQLNSTAGQMADVVNSKLIDDTLTVTEMHEMYAIGELLIQFGTFTRIKEILKIGIDCEHYGDDGEYALRLYVSKPQRPYLKT